MTWAPCCMTAVDEEPSARPVTGVTTNARHTIDDDLADAFEDHPELQNIFNE